MSVSKRILGIADDGKLKGGLIEELESLSLKNAPLADEELIQETRRLFNEAINRNSQACHPQDIEIVGRDAWRVTRFLLATNNDPAKAAERMVSCGAWRHRTGILDMRDEDFPVEFYQVGECVPFGTDRAGNGLLFVRCKYRKMSSALNPLAKNFLLHLIEKLDSKMEGRGMAMIFDCRGISMGNIDMDMMYFMYSSFQSYAPKMASYILFYEPPWFWPKIHRMFKAWLPPTIPLLFADQNTIDQLIDRDSLPYFMGGSSGARFRMQVPLGSQTLETWFEEGKLAPMSQSEFQRLSKFYRKAIDEVDAEEERAIAP